jgi:hypothetical protein
VTDHGGWLFLDADLSGIITGSLSDIQCLPAHLGNRGRKMKPRRIVSRSFCGWLILASCVLAQTREEKVRNDRRKIEAEGFWIYNDLAKGFAKARETGKPMLVVLRCLPCTECVKLDDELVDKHPRVRPLLEKFVCVRVVSTNGLDLSLFQFDTDQSFAAFMLNADRTIYGRFGTRSHRTEWLGDVSVEGLAAALEGALELHQHCPANRDRLAAKQGATPEFMSPEKYPSFEGQIWSDLGLPGKGGAELHPLPSNRRRPTRLAPHSRRCFDRASAVSLSAP